jgi:hypothetical protein
MIVPKLSGLSNKNHALCSDKMTLVLDAIDIH